MKHGGFCLKKVFKYAPAGRKCPSAWCAPPGARPVSILALMPITALMLTHGTPQLSFQPYTLIA